MLDFCFGLRYNPFIPRHEKLEKAPKRSTSNVRKTKKRETSTMAKSGPIAFFKQVRSEAKKVTWPTRHETTVSTIAVFVMVFTASLFLYFADQIIAVAVRLIMGFGF